MYVARNDSPTKTLRRIRAGGFSFDPAADAWLYQQRTTRRHAHLPISTELPASTHYLPEGALDQISAFLKGTPWPTRALGRSAHERELDALAALPRGPGRPGITDTSDYNPFWYVE
jgi:hypothetical protein